MNIFNWGTLVGYYGKHADSRDALEKWYNDISAKDFKKPKDLTESFNTARTIKNNRAIFNINGNAYRLIVEINYEKGWVFIKFLGTHAEYDKINPETVNYFKPKKK